MSPADACHLAYQLLDYGATNYQLREVCARTLISMSKELESVKRQLEELRRAQVNKS